LKALLARTHQANQRNLEDTAASKKATQDVSIELNSLKQKEELTMLESLRVQSIDSAFQYDVELSIQRAAEQMVSQQQIVQSNSQQTARRIKELEEERSLLNMQLESLQEEERGNELRTLSLNNEIDQLQRKLRESETARFESEARITCLHQQLEFEEMQRRNVEGELAATLSSQVKQLQETEAKSDTKATIKINAITQELHEMSSRLDSSERSGRVLQHEIDKLEADLRRNRGHAEELEAASNEIGRLNRMINELRDSRHLPAPRHLPCELPDRRCGLHPREGGCSDHRPGGQCVRMAGGGLQ
jgi:peptide deformylase